MAMGNGLWGGLDRGRGGAGVLAPCAAGGTCSLASPQQHRRGGVCASAALCLL